MENDFELMELVALLEEVQKRDDHVSTKYKALPKQELFHKSESWVRLVFGGNRSGKSRANTQEIYWWFTNTHPYLKTPKKARIWCLSVEYRTLFEGIWLHLKNVIPGWDLAKVGSKVPGWDLPSFVESKTGARIDFISAQGGGDARRKVQAAEVDLISVDEEISGDLWNELQMRTVSTGGKFVVTATLVESEDWLLDLRERALQGDSDIFHIQLDSRENEHNDQAALARVMGNLSADEYDIRILGKPRRQSGLIYANFVTDPHSKFTHCIKPFKIPSNFNRIMIFDPGFRTAAALWIAISPDNHYYAYREMYMHQADLSSCVEFFRRNEGWQKILIDDTHIWEPTEDWECIDERIIDPAAFNRQTDGSPSIGDRLGTEYDLQFTKGFNDKSTNIEDVRRMLVPTLSGKPQFQIFDDLENFKFEVRKYRMARDSGNRDRNQAKDAPIKRHDHIMNCLEYFASSGIAYTERHHKETLEELIVKPMEDIEFPEENYRRFRHRLLKERMQRHDDSELEY